MQTETTLRNWLGDQVDAFFDLGSAGSPRMLLRNAAGTAINIFTLAATPFTDASAGVITAQSLPITSSTSGSGSTETIDNVLIQNADTITGLTLGVSAGGSPDITLSSLTVEPGETYTLTEFTITIDAGSPTP